MSRHSSSPVKTFSVGFGEEINELPYARAVARKYSTEHHEVNLGSPDVASLLLRMVDVYDEPFADTSNIPTFRICGYARQFVKVVLSGDGGDELFGGYWWYPPLAESEKARGGYARWLVLRAASMLVRNRSRELQRRAVGAGLAARWDDVWRRDLALQTVVRPRGRRRLWGKSFPAFTPSGLFTPSDNVRGLDRAFHFDLTSYLPGDILVKVDRAAMAHGLETRAPFLDRDLVEFALSLPASLKLQGDDRKIVMREAFRNLWPEQLQNRGKQGFGAPYPQWLQMPAVKDLVRRVTRAEAPLRRLLPAVRSSDLQDSTYSSWALLTLGLWMERHPEVVTS